MNFCRRRSPGSQSTSRKCVFRWLGEHSSAGGWAADGFDCFPPIKPASACTEAAAEKERQKLDIFCIVRPKNLAMIAVERSEKKLKAALRVCSRPVGTGHCAYLHWPSASNSLQRRASANSPAVSRILQAAQHMRSFVPSRCFQDTTRGATTAEVVQSALTVLSSVGMGVIRSSSPETTKRWNGPRYSAGCAGSAILSTGPIRRPCQPQEIAPCPLKVFWSKQAPS